MEVKACMHQCFTLILGCLIGFVYQVFSRLFSKGKSAKVLSILNFVEFRLVSAAIKRPKRLTVIPHVVLVSCTFCPALPFAVKLMELFGCSITKNPLFS
jgi:hypothetical protein